MKAKKAKARKFRLTLIETDKGVDVEVEWTPAVSRNTATGVQAYGYSYIDKINEGERPWLPYITQQDRDPTK